MANSGAAPLAGEIPAVLFRTRLAPIQRERDSLRAWALARRLIARLQPLVSAAAEKQRRERQRERRRSELRQEIERCRGEIIRLRASPLDPDIIDDEVRGLEVRIRETEEELR